MRYTGELRDHRQIKKFSDVALPDLTPKFLYRT